MSHPPAQRTPALPYQVDFAVLAPRDIERMTGVSGAVQRVWRSKGLLEPRGGPQATFDIFDAASIAIRYRFSIQTRAPSETADLGVRYAPYLLYYVFMTIDGTCEALARSEDRLIAFEKDFRHDETIFGQLTRLDPHSEPDRFLIGGERGEIWATSEPLALYDEIKKPSGVFVDLLSLAEKFGLHAGRPLATIRLDGVDRFSSPPPRRRLLRP